MTADELREVRLLAFPLSLHQRSTEHHEELMREFQLLAIDPTPGRDVPARLVELMAQLNATYARTTEEVDAEREAARARGEETIDLTYRVPVAAAAAAEHLDKMLDEADAFCRAEQLLTLAATPEAVAFRKWYLGEFPAQLNGAPPTPWPAVARSSVAS